MARAVLRLALCVCAVQGSDSDAETIAIAAKALWPHWSWLAIEEHRDGISILAQNAGKNITVSKAIKDLKIKLPDHLQDIGLFSAQSTQLSSNRKFNSEFSTFSAAGKRKATFVRNCGREEHH